MTQPPERPLRVLQVIQNLNYGGMERILADLVRNLDRRRFESHVLTLQYQGRFAEGLEGYATLHSCDPLPRWSLAWPATLARQLRRIEPDVVHSHSGVWFKVSRAARMAGVPRIVHTVHGLPDSTALYARMMEGAAARRTDQVVAVSDPLADFLEARITRGRAAVRVIRNGVDTDAFRPRPKRAELLATLGIPVDRPVIGSVGRLQPVKRYADLLRAMAALVAGSEDQPPVLLLVGDGQEREALDALVRQLGIVEHVRMPGWRDGVPDLLNLMDLFVLASESEGTSVALLEAMASGCCPVVTAVGGNPDVLGPTLAHRLVPPAQPDALAAALGAALGDRAALARDRERARARVVNAYSLRSMVEGYESAYAAGARRRTHAEAAERVGGAA